MPKVEVRFENLNISADVQIGSRALPTLVNYTRDMAEVIICTFYVLFGVMLNCNMVWIFAVSLN